MFKCRQDPENSSGLLAHFSWSLGSCVDRCELIGEIVLCQRVFLDRSRSSVRPAASARPRRARARRARHTKSASSSCRRWRPVLCAGHKDHRRARRNGLMVMIGVVIAGDARHISRCRYFFTFCPGNINRLAREYFLHYLGFRYSGIWVSRPPPGPVRNGYEACTSRACNFSRQFGRYLELRLGILVATMSGDAFCGAANARGRLFRTPHAS